MVKGLKIKLTAFRHYKFETHFKHSENTSPNLRVLLITSLNTSGFQLNSAMRRIYAVKYSFLHDLPGFR